MKAVLVTGGAGYVGAHACKALREAGYMPVVLDNLSTGHREFVRWGPFVQADIKETEAVYGAIRTYEPEAVLHFAASAYVGESVTDPQKYYHNNVVGSLALLQAMLRTPCRRLVFSSTCAIYGEPAKMPITENTDKAPVNPYGASKAMVERILSDYAAAYQLESIALRYFNACGADPESQIGELRDPETHLIPRAMMALQGYVDDFAMFGGDYPTPDGTPIRDYIHVCDLADAHVAAVDRLLGGGGSAAFNVGTGQGYSVREIIAAIERETGECITVEVAPPRPGDPPVLVADASHARAELGFLPSRSDLATIIKTAWDWHRRAHPRKNVRRSAPTKEADATSL